VLIVDDSALHRAAIAGMLGDDPDLVVIGFATNGRDAIRAAARLKPDVITIDLRMPIMDGVEASKRIMEETPTPIVMVTASVACDSEQLALQAIEAGILTIIKKPGSVGHDLPAQRELVRTVKRMAAIKVVRHRLHDRLRTDEDATWSGVRSRTTSAPQLVAIGASTGGPQVLLEVLGMLPSDFPVPVVVVQHIAPGFVVSLIEWLRSQCALPVEVAEPGRILPRSGIVIADSNRHLTVRGGELTLTNEPPVSGHRPSATVLFQSVARQYGAAAVGILLTGMGDDGAAGLRDMKRVGATTIAQDEASSVVFGMPAVAIGLGVVDHVLPPDDIGRLLIELVVTGKSERPDG
jgi:two-component system chemotaxis response regulator CheB